ncbi:hypothetical protein [Deinococcus sp. YIM 77859]|uniref:hypothetical protein n=1 Tax=Deinococcus sp. YIM 77859 TaxID=1540221 RepID=UPI0005552DAC|nr:hypothetical protein [Deinococcus sp. YIM 77859]
MADRVTVERVTVASTPEDRVTIARGAANHPPQGRGDRNEREEARARLKESVDALAQQASLQVQLQKEPLKMLGGASAVGALVGLVIGRQFRRTKKVYVDAYSPEKHQKALIRAQKKEKGGGIGGALVATVTTLAVKTLNDRVLTPRLEGFADSLLERAGQRLGQPSSATGASSTRASKTTQATELAASTASTASGGVASFLKRQEGNEVGDAARVGVPGGPGMQSAPGTSSSISAPKSTVEAKAQGSPIHPEERLNPNIR